MFGRIRIDWKVLEALLQTTISLLIFTESCCITTAAFVSMSGSLVGVTSDTSKSKLPIISEPPSLKKPYFEDVGARNVSAVVGHTTILNCRVRYPGDRTVSWMRKRDLHILTSSIHTYTGDSRFSVIHPEPSDDWDLRIDFVQKRDAGVYECQVNTEPKINLAVTLYVQDSQASIQGSQDVYVKKGSTISLTCSVNAPSTPSTSVFWYHGTTVVDFDSKRGGVSLETEKTDSEVISKLLITKASLSDSGNYTCAPPNTAPATVTVHVLTGANPAAMQSAASYIYNINLFLTIFFILLIGKR